MGSTRSPLRWRAHGIGRAHNHQIRILAREFSPAMRPEALDVVIAAPATVDLPDLSSFSSPVEKATRLLQAAAAVEHGLLVQYLYAGYGFSGGNRAILDIAIEEMAHLMTVQNLLRLIGGDPDLSRQDFGAVDSDETRIFPFDLLLEPVTHESLAKYVVAESPRELPVGVDPTLMARIVAIATQGVGAPVNRVGVLYALLGTVFGSEEVLLRKAATGDPWYVMVNALAAEAAAAYGGRDKLHLPDNAFQPASADAQGSDRDWDRSVVRQGLDEFRVHVVTSRDTALEALRDIGLQGEGPSSAPTEQAHFMRFLNAFTFFYGAAGTGTGPAPNAAAVPRAARIIVDETSADPQAISHPETARWARLADHRYAILLGSLETYLAQPLSDRSFLLGWCFAEMFATRKLASILTRKPRSTRGGPEVASVPLSLPLWQGRRVTWQDLEQSFAGARIEIDALKSGGVGDDQLRFLGHLAVSDDRKLGEVRARIAGSTVRRNSDRAREILDWVAGAADPGHEGSSPAFPDQSQGRFWNLALPDLKLTEINGTNVVVPPAGGGDALLIRMLRSGAMPRHRSPLKTDEPEFAFLERWVNARCPDDPE